MVNNSVIIPIASLSAIVGVSLIFVVWWFPRTWAKGNAQERALIDENTARIRLEEAQAVIRNAQNNAAGKGDVESGMTGESGVPPAYTAVQPPKGYRPPVAGLG